MKASLLAGRAACALPFLSAALLGCSGGMGTVTLRPGTGSNILVDGTSLVLIDDSNQGGALERVDVASGEVTTLFQGSYPDHVLGGWVQADASSFYFVIGNGASRLQRIVALPRAGGAPVPLTPPGSYGTFFVEATNLYWFTAGQGVIQAPLHGESGRLVPGDTPSGGFAVDDETMYWVEGGNLVSAPVAGGSTTVLATGLHDFPRVALGSDSLYVMSSGPETTDCRTGPGNVASVPKSGGPMKILARNLYDLGPTAVSGPTAVFAFTSASASAGCNGDGIPGPWLISRVDGNGPAKQIGTSDWAQALATDGTDVYLVEQTSEYAPPTLRVLH